MTEKALQGFVKSLQRPHQRLKDKTQVDLGRT